MQATKLKLGDAIGIICPSHIYTRSDMNVLLSLLNA